MGSDNITVVVDTYPTEVTVSKIGIQGPPGASAQQITGQLTGLFYPLNSNPAGYVTSTAGGTAVAINNFSYLTGISLQGISGISILLSGTTAFINGGGISGQGDSNNTGILTGVFYSLNNPSGFITGINLSNYVTINQTGLLTGQFYPLNSNPSNYITSSQTGVFITTGQTGSFGSNFNTGTLVGTFALNSNTGNFITTSNTGIFATAINLGTTGSYLFGLINASIAGVSSLNSSSGALTLSGAGNISIINSSQIITVSGSTGIYSTFITTGQTGKFVTNNQTGLLTNVFYPLNSNPSSYITGFNSGLYVLNSNTGSFITSNQTGIFTTTGNLNSTGSYLLNLINASSAGVTNINGKTGVLTFAGLGNISVLTNGQDINISGSTGIYSTFVTTGQTGNFVTIGQASFFINSGNNLFSNGFGQNIKTVTGNYTLTNLDFTILFSGNNLTGTLPSAVLNSGSLFNVKNIFGSVIITGTQNIDTSTNYSSLIVNKGIELQSDGIQWWVTNYNPTGGLTGQFYPLNGNPNGYITTGQTGSFGGGGSFNTGTLTGTFAQLNTNNSFIGNNSFSGNVSISGNPVVIGQGGVSAIQVITWANYNALNPVISGVIYFIQN